MKTYAAYAKDDNLRIHSSSGAMFSLFSEYILSKNGVVYGVQMSDDCKSAEFARAVNIEELLPMRSSKYIQARLGNTFKNVKFDLESGKNVLFTGVGCQINGLKSFLGKDYPNLYCIDVVCHGVPSSKLWRQYVSYLEESYRANMISVNFRCKEKVSRADQHVLYSPKRENQFMRIFMSDVCLRPSCYECHAKTTRTSDITIADFWGIKDVVPEMADGKGVSLVLTRSDKGEKLFAEIQSCIFAKEVTYEEGVRKNPSEYSSCVKPLERDDFFKDINVSSFETIAAKYGGTVQVSFKVKRILKNFLIKIGIMKKRNEDYGLLFEMKK